MNVPAHSVATEFSKSEAQLETPPSTPKMQPTTVKAVTPILQRERPRSAAHIILDSVTTESTEQDVARSVTTDSSTYGSSKTSDYDSLQQLPQIPTFDQSQRNLFMRQEAEKYEWQLRRAPALFNPNFSRLPVSTRRDIVSEGQERYRQMIGMTSQNYWELVNPKRRVYPGGEQRLPSQELFL